VDNARLRQLWPPVNASGRGCFALPDENSAYADAVLAVVEQEGVRCSRTLGAGDCERPCFPLDGCPGWNGGGDALWPYVLTSDAPNIVAMRKAVPADTLKTFLDTYAWADAGSYATQLGPASVLFQYALHDDFSPEFYAQRYFDMSAGPKEVNFYDADHALNAEARRDRFKFLQQHLALQNLPVGTLEKVPMVR
jgi:hypothetical protein